MNFCLSWKLQQNFEMPVFTTHDCWVIFTSGLETMPQHVLDMFCWSAFIYARTSSEWTECPVWLTFQLKPTCHVTINLLQPQRLSTSLLNSVFNSSYEVFNIYDRDCYADCIVRTGIQSTNHDFCNALISEPNLMNAFSHFQNHLFAALPDFISCYNDFSISRFIFCVGRLMILLQFTAMYMFIGWFL